MSFKQYLVTTFSAVLLTLFGLFWWLAESLIWEMDREIGNAMEVAAQEAIASIEIMQTFVSWGDAATKTGASSTPPNGVSIVSDQELWLVGFNEEFIVLEEFSEEALAAAQNRLIKAAMEAKPSANGDKAPEPTQKLPHLSTENLPLMKAEEFKSKFNFSFDAEAGALEIITPTSRKTVPLPQTPMRIKLHDIRLKVLLGGGLIFAVLIALSVWMAHRISRPINELSVAAGRVGTGELGYQLPGKLHSCREVEQLGDSFNRMSVHLQKLDELKAKMEKSSQLNELGEIARGLAHTIRNPLNTLGLAMEQLSLPNLEEGRKTELAATARQQIQQVDQWVKSFLTLACGNSKFEDKVDLRELCLAIELECLHSLEKEVCFQFDFAGDLTVIGNQNELQSMLHTLMVNALEASPEGGEIQVSVSAEGDTVAIQIQDQGAGISDEIIGQLFEPHITSKAQGAGMGLYISRRIARSRYGGELALENNQQGALAQLTIQRHRSLPA